MNRRAEVAQESDFFGSMDGASKFVRGDAVAGILILFINIFGGLIVGTAQNGLSLEQATNLRPSYYRRRLSCPNSCAAAITINRNCGHKGHDNRVSR